MTNLNLRKKKIKDALIIHLVIIALLLAFFPIVLHTFLARLNATKPHYGRYGGGIYIWLIFFVIALISFARLLMIYIKFRKITFPTEKIHTVYCKKIVYGWMHFIKIKTHKGNFIYIPPRDKELSLEQLRGKYQKQTVALKCYDQTKFIKEI